MVTISMRLKVFLSEIQCCSLVRLFDVASSSSGVLSRSREIAYHGQRKCRLNYSKYNRRVDEEVCKGKSLRSGSVD